LRTVAHGDLVPAELPQAVCLPSDSFCDLQVYYIEGNSDRKM